MPLEVIPRHADQPERVFVSWGRGSDVQLGVMVVPDPSGSADVSLAEPLKVELAGQDIADLIRVLHRARAQAHGGQEVPLQSPDAFPDEVDLGTPGGV